LWSPTKLAAVGAGDRHDRGVAEAIVGCSAELGTDAIVAIGRRRDPVRGRAIVPLAASRDCSPSIAIAPRRRTGRSLFWEKRSRDGWRVVQSDDRDVAVAIARRFRPPT
jgi:hypothetical protein